METKKFLLTIGVCLGAVLLIAPLCEFMMHQSLSAYCMKQFMVGVGMNGICGVTSLTIGKGKGSSDQRLFYGMICLWSILFIVGSISMII